MYSTSKNFSFIEEFATTTKMGEKKDDDCERAVYADTVQYAEGIFYFMY